MRHVSTACGDIFIDDSLSEFFSFKVITLFSHPPTPVYSFISLQVCVSKNMGVFWHWGDYIYLLRPLCAACLGAETAQSDRYVYEAIQKPSRTRYED